MASTWAPGAACAYRWRYVVHGWLAGAGRHGERSTPLTPSTFDVGSIYTPRRENLSIAKPEGASGLDGFLGRAMVRLDPMGVYA